jgi:hypothetical protein
MSFSWQDMRYGWKALAGIVLTGATIYVVATTRQRVTQVDIVEIVLGTYERCLATQYGTNGAGEALYYVSPSNFVRAWITTNEAGGWATNAVTNAIGWRSDRAMLVACDALIKACVPYYVDTGTLEALTVTGLWASLGIGDGTNLFTREPEWVGTNGVTNAATYGEYPYRVYKTDLEERYKVLEALRATHVEGKAEWRSDFYLGNAFYAYYTNWAAVKDFVENDGEVDTANGTNRLSEIRPGTYLGLQGAMLTWAVWVDELYWAFADGILISSLNAGVFSTQIVHAVDFWYKADSNHTTIIDWGVGSGSDIPVEFDGYGQFELGGFKLLESVGPTNAAVINIPCSYGTTNFPTWCDDPQAGTNAYVYTPPSGYPAEGLCSGLGFRFEDDRTIVTWSFCYATNRYW